MFFWHLRGYLAGCRKILVFSADQLIGVFFRPVGDICEDSRANCTQASCGQAHTFEQVSTFQKKKIRLNFVELGSLTARTAVVPFVAVPASGSRLPKLNPYSIDPMQHYNT
jgi:hypothetical protein